MALQAVALDANVATYCMCSTPLSQPSTLLSCIRYAHVKPECLYASPAAKWWQAWEAGGGRREDLVVHIERNADFDGLAVAWGIGNTKVCCEPTRPQEGCYVQAEPWSTAARIK
jgi:hypothetical protein